ncbi:hypothetical protein DZ860_21140 [Vibrio sinensis]|uniref:DNA-binding protein n=1 Tax=Vibrio sinensis TaxID=2302434 RepID=A0A3A6QHV5_9VIBR|nr:hypothetical protein [Vibrio sinensis]RJX65867.1 hypothetical protein DZ860_21140 [Vibrio sinensis]
MKMTMQEMIDIYYDGKRKNAAEAAGISSHHLNNLLYANKEVLRLDNGDWIMLTKTAKIFKKPKL